MKMLSLLCRVRETHRSPRALLVRSTHPTSGRGFTLVEMLVVIAIIGMLASMVGVAAYVVLVRARVTAIAVELNQLDMACKAYKEKLGEYPPDFAGLTFVSPGDTTLQNNVRAIAQAAVLRHLARAFPRYQPGITTNATKSPLTGWAGFVADVSNGWGTDVTMLTPADALVFWLGGQPVFRTRTVANGPLLPPGSIVLPSHSDYDADKAYSGFIGFSADPSNPFAAGPSRINPFFDFAPARVLAPAGAGANPLVIGCRYWPDRASGNKSSGAILYFRAENGLYSVTASNQNGNPVVLVKTATDLGDAVTLPQPVVHPALDVRVSSVSTYVWMNPQSFQIFSAGMDRLYATPVAHAAMYPDPPITGSIGPYEFPTGANYGAATFDDITNFSNGTLENSNK